MWKRRHLYVLLFSVPALLTSIIVAAMLLAASAGALWLFVFGDDTWPPVASTLLGTVFLLSGAGLWVALLFVAYTVGKNQETRPTLSTAHVVLSIGATVGLSAVIAVRLLSPDGFGPPSDTMVCAEFCRAEGFVASGMPPQNSGDRTCTCYDAQGQEARRVSLAEIVSGTP